MSDLIKKRDAIETLNAVDVYGDGIGFEVLSHAIRDVSLLPTVEAEPVRRGEWIYGEHEIAMCDGYRCSKCGYFVPWDYGHKSIDYIKEYNYCPNCGAKMDERKEE